MLQLVGVNKADLLHPSSQWNPVRPLEPVAPVAPL